tara:strand:+ start:87 stop:260 length:174 start_codon:yes stop_codon:yes gene_type:complete
MTFEDWHKGYNPYKNNTFDADLKEAYEAGWNACADLNDSFAYDEVMSHLQEEDTDDV